MYYEGAVTSNFHILQCSDSHQNDEEILLSKTGQTEHFERRQIKMYSYQQAARYTSRHMISFQGCLVGNKPKMHSCQQTAQ